mmetsp:Transcript_26032/g.83028  ORF Transcript_26032/g.83028 Transcript_26032/m.83028 type:complete len:423 (-) Transcript_26032:36-1304(-)
MKLVDTLIAIAITFVVLFPVNNRLEKYFVRSNEQYVPNRWISPPNKIKQFFFRLLGRASRQGHHLEADFLREETEMVIGDETMVQLIKKIRMAEEARLLAIAEEAERQRVKRQRNAENAAKASAGLFQGKGLGPRERRERRVGTSPLKGQRLPRQASLDRQGSGSHYGRQGTINAQNSPGRPGGLQRVGSGESSGSSSGPVFARQASIGPRFALSRQNSGGSSGSGGRGGISDGVKAETQSNPVINNVKQGLFAGNSGPRVRSIKLIKMEPTSPGGDKGKGPVSESFHEEGLGHGVHEAYESDDPCEVAVVSLDPGSPSRSAVVYRKDCGAPEPPPAAPGAPPPAPPSDAAALLSPPIISPGGVRVAPAPAGEITAAPPSAIKRPGHDTVKGVHYGRAMPPSSLACGILAAFGPLTGCRSTD